MQRKIVGATAQICPLGLTVSAAQRACYRIWVTVFAPLRASLGIRLPGSEDEAAVSAAFDGVSEGTRTPDTQDHNLVL